MLWGYEFILEQKLDILLKHLHILIKGAEVECSSSSERGLIGVADLEIIDLYWCLKLCIRRALLIRI